VTKLSTPQRRTRGASSARAAWRTRVWAPVVAVAAIVLHWRLSHLLGAGGAIWRIDGAAVVGGVVGAVATRSSPRLWLTAAASLAAGAAAGLAVAVSGETAPLRLAGLEIAAAALPCIAFGLALRTVAAVRLSRARRVHNAARRAAAPAVVYGADETGIGRLARVGAALVVCALCGLIVWHVGARLERQGFGGFGTFYTITVTTYTMSRFLLAALYRPPQDVGFLPHVAIVVPAYNEGAAVARTIDACLSVEYPEDRLEVVVINDGSTDDTWDHMRRAAARYSAARVRCIDLGRNQGKRAAMAAGIRATSAEFLVFVDSDSEPVPNAIRKLVQGFDDERVAAISGITHVRNAQENTLTRMQAARYYISFQLLKSAESIVGAVACCSGCFAAYRRTAVLEVLEAWEFQRFLGTECTYGDDRALTNMILRRGWKAIYDCQAEASTDAPTEYRKFFRQSLRWKKSWVREGPILLSHIWRTRPLAFPSVLVATLSGLLSPIVLLWNLVLLPATTLVWPVVYLLALYLMSTAYALMHRAHRADGVWKYSILATFFYVSFSPQLVWAILRVRDGKWGTRGASPGDGGDGQLRPAEPPRPRRREAELVA
jgi:hyaluronan synthase